jgi:hypothetical protein
VRPIGWLDARLADPTDQCGSRSNGRIRLGAADPTEKYHQVWQIRRENMIACGRSDGQRPTGVVDPTDGDGCAAADPTDRQRIFLVNFQSAAIQIERSHGQVPNRMDTNSLRHWIASDGGFPRTADFSKGLILKSFKS